LLRPGNMPLLTELVVLWRVGL